MTNSSTSPLTLPRIILASGSPRRSEILESVGWDFEKIPADIDESEVVGEAADEYVVRLAVEKASHVARANPEEMVLGADTTVVVDGAIVGKPEDLADAERMIRLLSGRWHEVLTGVAIACSSAPGSCAENAESELRLCSGFQRTSVKFADLSATEVEYLVENGNPLDKAGAYAVQAQAALFVEEIRGDYWNVVGLPVSLVYKLVREFS